MCKFTHDRKILNKFRFIIFKQLLDIKNRNNVFKIVLLGKRLVAWY